MTLTTGRQRETDRVDQGAGVSQPPLSDVREGRSPPRPGRFWKFAGAVLSLAILSLSVWVLARTLATVNYAQLRGAIRDTDGRQIALSICCAAGSYLTLTGYDFLALRQLRLRVPYRTAALASFTSYAISFTIGFPIVTAGAVRYWIYSQVGVRASKVASLTVIAGVTFWLGMTLILGLALALGSTGLTQVDHLGHGINLALGLSALAGLSVYLVWVARGPRRTRIQGLRLELPGFALSVGQIFLGVVDLCCACGSLYVLLPGGNGMEFPGFTGIYVLACLLGIASNVPGGVGAFEATILKTVPSPSLEALVASLLLFRVIYYLVPFVLALALLGAHEVMQRWKSLRAAMVGDSEEEMPS